MCLQKLAEQKHLVPLSRCFTCKEKIKVRARYLYEKEQNGYLCKNCWDNKYDSINLPIKVLVDL